MKVGASSTTDSSVSNMQETGSVFTKLKLQAQQGNYQAILKSLIQLMLVLMTKTIRLRLVVNSSDGELIVCIANR